MNLFNLIFFIYKIFFCEMATINIKLNRSKGTIVFNFHDLDNSELKIVRYQANGLTSDLPIYIKFNSGNMGVSPVYGGTNDPSNINVYSNEFMLPVSSIPNSNWEFNNPIFVMRGDNLSNASRQLDYEIADFNGNPIVFQLLCLTLEVIQPSRYNPELGKRLIKPVENMEVVSRNQLFNDFLNFDQRVPHNGYNNM